MPGNLYGPGGDGYQGTPGWAAEQINALFRTFDALSAALAGYVALPAGTPEVGQVLVVESVDPLVLVWADGGVAPDPDPDPSGNALVIDSGDTLVTDTGDRLVLVLA